MVLAAKILLAPLFVVGASLAGRRWGIAVAGLLVGFPMVAGPILLVETMVHGRDFGAHAAAAALLGLAALTAFVVVYGRQAPFHGPLASVLSGWAGFLLAVGGLSLVHPPAGAALALVALAFVAGLRLLPPGPAAGRPAGAPPAWDLAARALAALALVLGLTAVSGALGPHLSGLLAPFPVLTSVLAAFTQAHSGTGELRILLRNFLFGFYGFAAFCFTLALALPSLATGASFGLAAVASVVAQAATLVLRSQTTVDAPQALLRQPVSPDR
jgi:hypothetical protein